jgi:hypothetical protein
MSVSDVGNEPQFRVGLGGNYYVYCKIKEPVVEIAKRIGRSPNSVYYRSDFDVWAIRVRLKKHKELLRTIFKL